MTPSNAQPLGNGLILTRMSLVALLPSTGYLLAYSLPLLLLSVPLTFAGPLLTLDRTRVFPPRADAGYTEQIPGSFGQRKSQKKLRWKLEGGLGGLMIGYSFGCTSEYSMLFSNSLLQ
jgi:hypothetical protein